MRGHPELAALCREKTFAGSQDRVAWGGQLRVRSHRSPSQVRALDTLFRLDDDALGRSRNAIMDIGDWLRSLGLERYEAAFRENEIDETVLPGLTHETLKEVGVTAVGHRLKLLDAIA